MHKQAGMKRESGETPGRSWALHPPKLSHNALSIQELTRSKQVSDVRERHKVTETWREKWSKKKSQELKKLWLPTQAGWEKDFKEKIMLQEGVGEKKWMQ